MNSNQLRAGRSLIRWSQKDLSDRSGVSVTSVKRFEAMDGEISANRSTILALQRALEEGGVIFFDAGEGGAGGEGVRLRGPQE